MIVPEYYFPKNSCVKMVNICYLLVAIFAQQKDPFNNIYRAANTMISCSYPMKRLMKRTEVFYTTCLLTLLQ